MPTEEELYKSGIYIITNKINSHQYIGQAKNIKKRWLVHESALLKNRGHNRHLKNAWNKYGSKSFSFEVLEFCKVFDLDYKEQYWIDKIRPIYNIAKNNFNKKYWFPVSKDGDYEIEDNYIRPSWHKWVYGGVRKPT